jgi:hypothetical protein
MTKKSPLRTNWAGLTLNLGGFIVAMFKTQGQTKTGGADSQPCPNTKGPKVAKIIK